MKSNPVVLALLVCSLAACSSNRAGRGGGGGGGGAGGGGAAGGGQGGAGGQGGQGVGGGAAEGGAGGGGDVGNQGGQESDGGEAGGRGAEEEEGNTPSDDGGTESDAGEADDGGEADAGGTEEGEFGGEGEGEGEGVDEAGAIQVLPRFVDFGEVELGRNARRFLTVTNVGLGDLTVEGMELLIHDAGDFQVTWSPESPFEDLPATLEPEEFFELIVTFVPEADGPATAELAIESDDPVVPDVVVDLQGRGVEEVGAGPCVAAEPENINWGQVALGATEARQVAVVNCGDEPIRVAEAGLDPDSSEAFDFHGDVELPLELGPGETWRTTVEFGPVEAGEHTGVFEVETDEGDLFIELSGRAVAEDAVFCRAQFRVGRGAWVELDGGLIHAGLGETVHMRLREEVAEGLALRWQLVERPEGSRSRIVPDDDSLEVSFDPDVLGEYDVEVDVERLEDGESTTCAGSVRAIPERDIVVQIAWDTPQDPDQEDEGFGAGSDMDIHFLHPLGDWFCQPRDCYYANPTPDWGVAFDPADDPSLDIDDTDGLGPEQISLSGPEDGAAYRIGVHYFNDHGYGPSTVTIRVFIRGVLEWESAGTQMAGTDAWWVPAVIHWADGRGRVEEMEQGPVNVPPQEDCPN